MQGDELVPGGKNVLRGSTRSRPPHRRGRDREINPLKNLRKSARCEIGAHLFAIRLPQNAASQRLGDWLD